MRRRLKLATAVVGVVVLAASAGFASNPFTDVSAGRYYTNAVAWAFSNGVTTGTSATTFSPEQNVTRGQNVTFAYRYDQNVVQPALSDIDGQLDAVDEQLDAVDDRFDGLDTLDELSCTASQVAINDGGWRCADPVLQPTFREPIDQALVAAGNIGFDPSIAIGNDGNPIIAHSDSDGGLELYVCADATCTSGTNRVLVEDERVGKYPSATIGVDGNPVISHFNDTFGDLELYRCGNPACSSGTNHILETADRVGYKPSMVIGAEGNPMISHQDLTNGDLELYVCDDPACSNGRNSVLPTGGITGSEPAIAVGADGSPIISYRDSFDVDLRLYVGPATTYAIVFE